MGKEYVDNHYEKIRVLWKFRGCVKKRGTVYTAADSDSWEEMRGRIICWEDHVMPPHGR